MGESRSFQVVALGARVHLFVQPADRTAFVRLFRDTLGCSVAELDFGLEYPLVLISFEDGSAFSVEFSDLALAPPRTSKLDDADALRGAWIEFRVRDVEAAQAALRAAGVPEFQHPGSRHAYFAAPGGQVFRLLDLEYRGP